MQRIKCILYAWHLNNRLYTHACAGIAQSLATQNSLTQSKGTLCFLAPEGLDAGCHQDGFVAWCLAVFVLEFLLFVIVLAPPYCQICSNEKDDCFGASGASSASGPPSQLQKKAALLLHAPALDVYSFGIMVAMIFNQGQLYPKMRQHEIMAGVIGNRLRPALPKCLSAEVLAFVVL